MSKKTKEPKLTKAQKEEKRLFLLKVAEQAKAYYDSISAGQFHGVQCPACGNGGMLQTGKNYEGFTEQQYVFKINLRCNCGKGWLYMFTETFNDKRRVIARK